MYSIVRNNGIEYWHPLTLFISDNERERDMVYPPHMPSPLYITCKSILKYDWVVYSWQAISNAGLLIEEKKGKLWGKFSQFP